MPKLTSIAEAIKTIKSPDPTPADLQIAHKTLNVRIDEIEAGVHSTAEALSWANKVPSLKRWRLIAADRMETAKVPHLNQRPAHLVSQEARSHGR